MPVRSLYHSGPPDAIPFAPFCMTTPPPPAPWRSRDRPNKLLCSTLCYISVTIANVVPNDPQARYFHRGQSRLLPLSPLAEPSHRVVQYGLMSLSEHAKKWRAVPLPVTPRYALHFDGSCRPNPGPMGVGYTLVRVPDFHRPIVRVGAQVGTGTNNVAEYTALLHGLRHALRLGMWSLSTYSDSNLLVRQLWGLYKVRDRTLARLHREALLLLDCFHRGGPGEWPAPVHIPRDENGAADELSRTLTNEGPTLPPPPGRALHGWQAAALNVWWHNRGVRSSTLLGRVFGVQATQVDQIVGGTAYKDASFDGMPAPYAPSGDSKNK
jgi:ribonuclease HI